MKVRLNERLIAEDMDDLSGETNYDGELFNIAEDGTYSTNRFNLGTTVSFSYEEESELDGNPTLTAHFFYKESSEEESISTPVEGIEDAEELVRYLMDSSIIDMFKEITSWTSPIETTNYTLSSLDF